VKFKGVFSTVIAIAFGFLVLAGYLFGVNAGGTPSLLGQLQLFILNVAVILAGFAVLVGISNLMIVHADKIHHNQKGAVYSAILIIALLVTFVLGLLDHYNLPVAKSLFSDAFLSIQLPIETSLMALLVVTLTYASIRLLRRRMNLLSVIFLATAFLILVGTAPWPFLGDVPILSSLRTWIAQFPASAGARGILFGVALGTLTTGLRILFGTDRPYGGKHG
jgi:cytochrome bd-type quinol oxidase subunit 2